MDPSETTTHDGGTATQKRHRASKAEMSRRERIVVKMLQERGKIDAYEVKDALDLTYPQTVTLLSNLKEDGVIINAGKDRRRTVYRMARIVDGPPRKLRPVDVASILEQLHLGSSLEVIGLRIEGESPLVEVRVEGAGQDLALAVLV